jgi:hypothetical protein
VGYTEAGLSTSLYLTEEAAYIALADDWFVPAEDGGDEQEQVDYNDHQAMLTALRVGGIPAASRWVDEYLEAHMDSGRVMIERHDHPWVFAEEAA